MSHCLPIFQNRQCGADNLIGMPVLLHLLFQAESMQDSLLLSSRKNRNQWSQVPTIRGFERADIILPVGVADNQRKQTCFKKNQGFQGACYSAIAVLEWMNLSESMM